MTDPPYGIGFHNERWDGQAIQEAAAHAGHERLSRSEAYQAWCRAWGQECLRVLKPGGQLLAFGSPRTAHRLAAGLEDAGLELRDTLLWHYLLDRLGAQLVAAQRGLDLADLNWTRAKTLRLATSTQLGHLIEASGFFTRLAHALRAAPDAALLAWWGQRRCAQRWGDLVRPDGHARLAVPTGQLEVWLEWDRATEPHARLRDKLDRYEELALALDQALTLLFVAPGDRRERHILDGLRPADGVCVLATTAGRHHADPLAPNWLAHDAERRVALADLATTSSAAPGTRPGRARDLLPGSSAGPTHPELTITEPDEPPT